jgi:hypothetical protein
MATLGIRESYFNIMSVLSKQAKKELAKILQKDKNSSN